MDRRGLTRRALLRRSLATSAGGVTAAALGTPGAAAPEEATPLTEGTPTERGAIALATRGGDVWAWEKRIAGTCPSCPSDATISLRVNDAPIPAERAGDAFGAVVKLQPGENRVVAVATLGDGREEVSATVVHTVRLEPRPTARIAVTIERDTVVLDASGSDPSEYDGASIGHYAWSARPGNPAALTLDGGAGTATEEEVEATRVTAVAPTVDGEYYVSLRVVDDAGREDIATAYFAVKDGKARVPDPVTENAAWIERAVIYGAIPRNFGDPGFKAMVGRLDDLRDLGVTAIWLSPINRTIPDYFGYEVIDYFALRSEYGTEDDFRELVREAHVRGIRVVMDFVPNHTSERHPYFRDAEAHGPASAFYDFYDRDAGGNVTHYFDWSHLPNLNYDNPEVQRFMLEAFSYWVREFDVDGFRVDVAWGIRERKPEFWPVWSHELNRIKPDALLLAEASARDPFYFDNGFDAAYDWTDELGHWAWGDAFGDVAPMAQAMRRVLTNEGAGDHPDALAFRFLNNNDTGPRFVTTYGVDFYRVAAAMLLTLPGLPCIYTGDEVGAEFLPYETTGPIDWTDGYGLRDHFKKLVTLRREQPSLHSRHWLPLEVEPTASLFGYLRHAEAADPPVLVLLNFSGASVEAQVPLPAEFAGLARGNALTDLLADERVLVAGPDPLTLPVPAWGARMLVGAET